MKMLLALLLFRVIAEVLARETGHSTTDLRAQI
jgi:hypothetical protein